MEILDGDDKIKINPLIPEVLKVEVTTEASKEVPKIETTIPEIPKVEVITEASKEVLKIETTIPEVPKVEVITEASKEIPKIETSITEILKPVLTKAQMDEVAVAMGTESFDVAVDMIKELADIKSRVDDKAGQWQVDDLQRQICSLKEENKELTAFKEATEEKELMDVLPKGIWTGEVEVDGVLVPKIKMIADEIRKGGVAVMLKYVKGAASGSIVNGKASEDVLENGKPKEIKTKGSSEASEIQDEGSDQKERVIKAVNDFTKKYMNGV